MTRKSTRKLHSESGLALLTAIFTVLLLTAIGAGMVMLTTTDTSISANFRDEQTAFFSAKAGMEEIRDRFRVSATNTLSGSLPKALPGNASAFLYVLNPKNGEVDTPWATNGSASVYPDTEVCKEMANMGPAFACAGTPPVMVGGGWYTTATASNAYAMTPVASWKWTRINLKTNQTSSGSTTISTVDGNVADTAELVCWTGSYEITTTLATCSAVNPNYQPIYVMTTLAVTPTGSRRMIQAEAAASTFPTLPGPMIFDGSNPIFNVPNSAAFNVSGMDTALGGNNGAGCPAAWNQAALGGYNNASVTTLQSDASNRPSGYTGAPGTGTPSVANVYNQLTSLTTVGGLESLASAVDLVAGNEGNVYSNNPPSIVNPGTNANPQVNVVNGNLTLPGGWSGSGILLVTGTLTFQGQFSFNGLILVIGSGAVVKNGGGNGVVDGSLLVANLYDSNGNLLPPSSAPGVPSFNWNGGGNFQGNYDSCWSQLMNNSVAYRVVAVREMMF
jgi:hypothetical protein